MNIQDKILISIIVPVYKVENFIHTCIQSVLNQTYTNWELILVDDGSPDNCPKICDEYSEKDKRIKVLHKENGGVASARNFGIDAMKGEFLTFLDSDDFYHPEYLETLITLGIKYNADIVQCEFIRGTNLTFPKVESKKNIYTVVDNYDVFLKGYAKIIVWAKLYKKNILEGLKIPENTLFEDDFITWKWYFKAKQIVFTNKVLYYYFDNNESTMAGYKMQPKLDFMKAYIERINFFIDKNEKSMEDYSRMHFCKALVLTYNNKMLTKEQKNYVISNFRENWLKITNSQFVPFHLKILFYMFILAPKSTSIILNLKK